jgi:mono/diheme cytochrome c family protein
LSGCIEQRMAEQPRYEPYEPSRFFSDGASIRQPVPHTQAQGAPAGRVGRPVLTRALVLRGQERYAIYCAPCHGQAGDGTGVIPAHGYPTPPSYHQDRLRRAPDEHFYDVISRGYGVMYPYADRVSPEERWAIIAYIRALQVARTNELQSPPAGGTP